MTNRGDVKLQTSGGEICQSGLAFVTLLGEGS